jgi:hypothetical protein
VLINLQWNVYVAAGTRKRNVFTIEKRYFFEKKRKSIRQENSTEDEEDFDYIVVLS